MKKMRIATVFCLAASMAFSCAAFAEEAETETETTEEADSLVDATAIFAGAWINEDSEIIVFLDNQTTFLYSPAEQACCIGSFSSVTDGDNTSLSLILDDTQPDNQMDCMAEVDWENNTLTLTRTDLEGEDTITLTPYEDISILVGNYQFDSDMVGNFYQDGSYYYTGAEDSDGYGTDVVLTIEDETILISGSISDANTAAYTLTEGEDGSYTCTSLTSDDTCVMTPYELNDDEQAVQDAADSLSWVYEGATEDGIYVCYAGNQDSTSALMLLVSTDDMSYAKFSGELTVDAESDYSAMSIVDAQSGAEVDYTLSTALGHIQLDIDGFGLATVSYSTIASAIETLVNVNANGTDALTGAAD